MMYFGSFFKLVILICYCRSVWGGGLTLQMPKYALAGKRIKVTCISTTQPQDNTVEFLVNQKTLTNIRILEDTCFDTVLGQKCHPNHCVCSSDRKEYHIYHLVNDPVKSLLTFSCRMKLKEYGAVIDAKSVIVIGPPELSIDNNRECNTTMTHTLVCRRSHTVAKTGFIKWTHTFKNITIRHVGGITNNGMSLLVIPSCSYQDRGRYTCTAWYDIGDGKQYIRRATDLKVLGSPEFINKSSHREGSHFYLNAVFVPLAITTNIYWLENGVKIENSSNPPIENKRVVVNVSIYSMKIEISAIRSELQVRYHQENSNYKICAQTRRGISCLDVLLAKGKENNQSSQIYYIATIVGLVIVVVSGTLIFLKGRRLFCKKINIKQRSVPPQLSNVPSTNPRLDLLPEGMENPQYNPIAEYEQDVHRYDKRRESTKARPLDIEIESENQGSAQARVYFEVQGDDIQEDDGYEHVE